MLESVEPPWPVDKVVRVVDGDTVYVAPSSAPDTQVKLRLSGIDSPETLQNGGPEAADAMRHLLRLYAGKGYLLYVDGVKRDRYGRTLGSLIFTKGDHRLDVQEQMLREGHAWHYVKYDSSPRYAQAEEYARSRRLGLWESPTSPIPPWEWRHGSKGKQPSRRLPNNRKVAIGDDQVALRMIDSEDEDEEEEQGTFSCFAPCFY